MKISLSKEHNSVYFVPFMTKNIIEELFNSHAFSNL